MGTLSLSAAQQAIIEREPVGSVYLEGPAGSGKTTAAVAWLDHLLHSGIPGDQILILTPQRTLAQPYVQAVQRPDLPPGSLPVILTLNGLAQRLVSLFWPVVARDAGFAHPEKSPVFLTAETAQFYMAQVVDPLLEEGYFDGVTIDRNRLFSQILDNLNKAAFIGFEHTELATRLKAAWVGKPAQLLVYDQAQECANRFRQYCLENNLLDFSLQLEIFYHRLWTSFLVRNYLTQTFTHLIYDNIEEDVPAAHDILQEWLPSFTSALVINDSDGGYRAFLGADTETGTTLAEICKQKVQFEGTYVTNPRIDQLSACLSDALLRRVYTPSPAVDQVHQIHFERFYPAMIGWIGARIESLVHEEGVAPGEIAILAPFVSDSLRFSLMAELESRGIPARSHRPSRTLRDEPATRCLLTLAKLAHPDWELPITRQEIRVMLMQSFGGMDLIRADLCAQTLFSPKKPREGLASFDRLVPAMQERITHRIGEKLEALRAWLDAYRTSEPLPLDGFLARIFGELLSQPGFGFAGDLEAAAVTARLVESVQKFRRAASDAENGKLYMQMIAEGVIAAQSPQSYEELARTDAVLISPAHTFLMTNRPAQVQFWLDAGSLNWWQRLMQPLTHPYVLSRRWPPDRKWTDVEDYSANQESLARMLRGLLRRCSGRVFVCSVTLNERGDEEHGPLLQAFQSLRRRLNAREVQP
ncbi:superfamily I DNA and RNA helicase [Longilinea arvoryzae]|uniref:Superfamily I DNA and RNA helicase n=1 Tax=Longilinea arvoryzae TaxID=360412 RepID=A0A0S7BB83_9CHLR|nr:UvrD-helicase domain-containing protein [Longilinea arvoryzae]GAP15020.1 superfamily I DNA and RNA helicase [Longilinea arvoryzae]